MNGFLYYNMKPQPESRFSTDAIGESSIFYGPLYRLLEPIVLILLGDVTSYLTLDAKYL